MLNLSRSHRVAVEASGVRYAFGRVEALAGVDLSIPAGAVFGLLGPNGAGKTTTIRALAGLIRPSAGTVCVDGERVRRGRPGRSIGVAVERPAFYPHLSGRANLELLGRLRLSVSFREDMVEAALSALGLSGEADRRFGAMSAGIRQRLACAAAILGEPALVLLDEPTANLDPAGIVMVRDAIEHLRSHGRTILLSSHQLGEVERLCDLIGVMVRGRIVRQGVVEALLSRGQTVLAVSPEDAPRVQQALAAVGIAATIERQGGQAVVSTASADPSSVAAVVEGVGVVAASIQARAQSLEGFYLQTVADAAE